MTTADRVAPAASDPRVDRPAATTADRGGDRRAAATTGRPSDRPASAVRVAHDRPATRPRVVIADDSSLMRRILARTLDGEGFDVVGEAADGDEALALCGRLRPDALTLDLHMPGTDGLAVLRALGAAGRPAIPAVVVSAFSPALGARAVDALAEGAFDLVAKPGVGQSPAAFSATLGDKLRAAAELGRRRADGAVPSPPAARATSPAAGHPTSRITPTIADPPANPAAPTLGRPASANPPDETPRPAGVPRAKTVAGGRPTTTAGGRPATGERLVLVACSTGGPRALAELLPALPAPLGAGLLVVQHMPPGFTGSLAARLDGTSALRVREAAPGTTIRPGDALIAPGGRHLRLTDPRAPELTDEAPIGGLRPRADLTIADAARLWGPRLLLVVLTGMGRDGLEGAREVRRHGGRTLVEAEDTCTVYGMPRAIAEAGLADRVVPLPAMAGAILRELA